MNNKKILINNKNNINNLNNDNKTNDKAIEENQNKYINNKEIISIDENYNDVNYWKIKIDSNIIIISNKNEKDEENELLNIALNSEKKEKYFVNKKKNKRIKK